MTIAAPTFDAAFAWIIDAEGATYTDDPADPGGGTKYGIAQRYHPNIDVRNLSLDQAREIYRSEYWKPCRGDDLPSAWALALFDASVLHGVRTGVRLMQLSLRVSPDGVVGPETIEAAQRADRAALASFLTWRAHELLQAPAERSFIRGWMLRLFRLQGQCLDRWGGA